EIRENNDVVTQITTVKVPPQHQAEVLQLMAERARFMAMQPGFVSVSLHKSEDGSHLVNYVQWRDRNKLAAAHHSPEFRKKMAALRPTRQRGGAVSLPSRSRRGGMRISHGASELVATVRPRASADPVLGSGFPLARE